ncbi:MAG: alpha/beta hydrolase [Ponticaulis sp.]|nr:alpha/beta hydrolase [Ponticaulis sp.]
MHPLRVAGFLLAALTLSSCVSSAMYTSRVETRHPPEGEFVSLETGQLHLVDQGDGAPVLMIHGASANVREFMITLVPELQDNQLRLLIPDRPGHGYSDRFEDADQLGEQASAFANAVRQRTDEPVVVVGHSFGGAVALRFALDYPELTRSVVLIAPVTHDWGSGGITWYNQAAALPVIGYPFSHIAPLVGPSAARSSLTNLFAPAPVPDDYAERLGVDLLFRPPNFRANAHDMVSLQSEIQKQDDRYAGELAVKVVVFSGSGDTVIKPALHAARLKRELPDNVVLVKLDDEGHMPHHQKAPMIADTISRLARGESVQLSDFET